MDILFQEQNKLSEKAVCVVHNMSFGLEIWVYEGPQFNNVH